MLIRSISTFKLIVEIYQILLNDVEKKTMNILEEKLKDNMPKILS